MSGRLFFGTNTLPSQATIVQTQGAATQAQVVGTADITAGGLYGGGGTLTGKHLDINVGSGVQVLNWNGATNALNEANMLAAITAFFMNAAVPAIAPLVASQGGGGGNKLVLTNTQPLGFITIDPGSTSLTQLGLVAATTSGTAPQEHAITIRPANGANWSFKLFSLTNLQGSANNIFKQGWNVDGEDLTKPALYDSYDWNGQDISPTHQCFNRYWFAAGVGGINPVTPINFDYDTINGNNIISITAIAIDLGAAGNSAGVGQNTVSFNYHSSSHQFFLQDPTDPTKSVQIENLTFPFAVPTAAVRVVNPAAPLTVYGISMNGVSQRLFLQADQGTVQVGGLTGQLTNHDTSLAILIWDSATRSVQLGSTLALGSGSGVLGVADALTVPTTNPAGGGILYSSGGQGAWRRSDGTVIGFG